MTRVPSGRRRRGALAPIEALESRCMLSLLTVTSAVDGADGSLRDAVGEASRGDVIRFSPALRGQSLPITEGEIVIDTTLSILGSGQSLDAGGQSRIFRVRGPATSVTMSGLRLTGGRAEFSPQFGYLGGAILSEGADLTLQSTAFAFNSAVAGDQSLDNSFVAPAGGGAIAAVGGSLTLVHSTFAGNSALGGANTAQFQAGEAVGGAIDLVDSRLSITGGTFDTNRAQGGDALVPIPAFGTSDGGFAGGGAIGSSRSDVTAVGTRFVNNLALGGRGLDGSIGDQPGGGGQAAGGAIEFAGVFRQVLPSRLDLRNAEFFNNDAIGGDGGGMADASQQSVEGGRAGGGAVLTQLFSRVEIRNSRFESNRALGGGVGASAPDSGENTGFGGPALGGALQLDSPERVRIDSSRFSRNVARGGLGADAPADGSTFAGAGGWSYGGALSIDNQSNSDAREPLGARVIKPSFGGPLPISPSASPFVLPVTLQDNRFAENSALGGQPGSGAIDPSFPGGGSQGGAVDVAGLLQFNALRNRWDGNRAVAGPGILASGGAVAIAYGGDVSLNTFRGDAFRENRAVGGRDPRLDDYREASGGALFNNSPSTFIDRVSFERNVAEGGPDTGSGFSGVAKGGAIDNTGGQRRLSVTVNGATFRGNEARGGRVDSSSTPSTTSDVGTARGGAIFNDVDGRLSVRGARFLDNLAEGSDRGDDRDAEGGAIYVSPDTLPPSQARPAGTLLAGTLFRGNRALAFNESLARGGALFNAGGVLEDTGSLMLQNLAVAHGGTAFGGAVVHDADPSSMAPTVPRARFVRTVIALNAAIGNPRTVGGLPGQGFGGGIAFLNDPRAELVQTLIRLNRATTADDDVFGSFQPLP